MDREVLVSCKMLKWWDLIHHTFTHETVGSYVMSSTPSKVRISKVQPDCKKLKDKILRKYHIQIHKSRNIQPVHINKPYDVSYYMRKPAKEEFREMIKGGMLVPNNEPSDWCSQTFPRLKPGIDPPRCRWVTDF